MINFVMSYPLCIMILSLKKEFRSLDVTDGGSKFFTLHFDFSLIT